MSSYKVVYRELANYQERMRAVARRLQRIEAAVSRHGAGSVAGQTPLVSQARDLQSSARSLAELSEWMKAAGDAAGEAAQTLLLAEYRNCQQLEPAAAPPAPQQPDKETPGGDSENSSELEEGTSEVDNGKEEPVSDQKDTETDSQSDSTSAADNAPADNASPKVSGQESEQPDQVDDDAKKASGVAAATTPLSAAAATAPLAAAAATPESPQTAGSGGGGSYGGAPGGAALGADALPTDIWDAPVEDADLDLPEPETEMEPMIEPAESAPPSVDEGEAVMDESGVDEAVPAQADGGKSDLRRAAILGTAGLGSALAAGGIALKSGKKKKAADDSSVIHPTKGIGQMTATADGGLNISAQGNPEIIASVGGMVQDSVGWRAPDFRVDPTAEGYKPGPDDYGNYVTIVDDDGRQYLYAHLSELSPNLKNGARIQAGSTLGRMGSTGNSQTDHLHLEVATSEGVQLDPVAALGLKT